MAGFAQEAERCGQTYLPQNNLLFISLARTLGYTDLDLDFPLSSPEGWANWMLGADWADGSDSSVNLYSVSRNKQLLFRADEECSGVYASVQHADHHY